MKKIEQTFEEADQILTVILNAAPVGFILVDNKGLVKHFNKESEHLFGYSRDDVIDKPVESLLPEQIREHHPELLASYFKDPSPRMMGAGRELFGQRKDGSQFPIEIGLGSVEIGKYQYGVAVVVDITEKLSQEDQKKSQLERAHYEDLMELSSPLLSVWPGIKVLPLIGTLDSRRTQDAMEKALTCMAEEEIRILIVDITGVLAVDTMVSDHLLRMASGVRLMGGECILTGISPEVARTVTQLGVDLSTLHTRSTLHEGLALGIKFIEAEKGV